MTPIGDPENEEQIKYNSMHVEGRNCIERTNGVLKVRFGCLGKDSQLRYGPTKAGAIINCCVILHNILVLAKYPMMEGLNPREVEAVIINDRAAGEDNVLVGTHLLTMGRQIRNRLCREFCSNA